MLKGVSLNQIGKLLFAFNGRINRAKYWLALLIAFTWVVIGICVIALSAFASPPVGLLYVLPMIVVIPLFIVGIAIGIKRLHDRDKSGWWLVLFYVVPAILESAADRFDKASDGSVESSLGAFFFYICSFAVSVWAFVEIGCLRGTTGPNRYGPDPLQQNVVGVFD